MEIHMRERALPRTRLTLTEIAFGAASLGNLYRASTDEEARAAVDAAWTGGIRYFDTAPHYGLGLSERRIGEALSRYPREEYVLSTKVGRLIVPNEHPTEVDDDMFVVPADFRREWDFSRDGIRLSVEQSLQRLGLDRIDILYLHDPDVSGIPDAASAGAAALIELRDEGMIRAVGIGSNDTQSIAELLTTTDIDTAMLAGRYTLLEQRGAEQVFEAAGDRRITIAGVFNSGLLAQARPDANAEYNYAPAPADIVARANRLADATERHGVQLPQAAMAYPLLNSGVASVALGMRTAAEVRTNLALAAREIPQKLWSDL